MSAIIPDSLEGALILSLIDFFLSFLVISFIGVVLAGFPLLNRLNARITNWRSAEPRPVSVQADAALPEIPEEHVAVIAAAVYAMIGPHRILHLSETHLADKWIVAGRLVHHTSHAPPHHPKH
jgi:hypothetical protein